MGDDGTTGTISSEDERKLVVHSLLVRSDIDVVVHGLPRGNHPFVELMCLVVAGDDEIGSVHVEDIARDLLALHRRDYRGNLRNLGAHIHLPSLERLKVVIHANEEVDEVREGLGGVVNVKLTAGKRCECAEFRSHCCCHVLVKLLLLLVYLNLIYRSSRS